MSARIRILLSLLLLILLLWALGATTHAQEITDPRAIAVMRVVQHMAKLSNTSIYQDWACWEALWDPSTRQPVWEFICSYTSPDGTVHIQVAWDTVAQAPVAYWWETVLARDW